MLDRWNLYLFPVLGHRPAGDLDILVGELVSQRTVTKRFGFVLFLNQLSDAGLDRFGCQGFFAFPGYCRGEEVFQLVDALRRMGIFI